MVHLESYRCHNCSKICERTDAFGVGICVECGKLTCGPCRTLFKRKEEKATKCTITQKYCEYTSYHTAYIDFLHKFPPDHELKLLNYGKWCPVWCANKKCASSFATQRIGFVDRSSLCCAKCRPADKVVKEPPIDTYMSIIDELRNYYSDQECIVAERKRVQISHFKCEMCHSGVKHPICLTSTGGLLCKSCKDKSSTSYNVSNGNLSFLSILLLCIPDTDDLKLLTYSKWTPLRCELCSTMLTTNVHQLPMFHPGCSKLLCNPCNDTHNCTEPSSTALLLKWVLDVEKELRSLFKNGGSDSSENQVLKSDVEESLQDIICLPLSNNSDQLMSVITGFPKEIRCECCALFIAPNDLRRCVDCEKSCLCFACLTKKHWGHTIEEITITLQTAFIQKESEKTLQKFAKWRESLNEGNKQIDVVSMKVVDNYNCLYPVAVRESDLGLLQAIREWGDIGQLQDSVGEFTVAQIKFRVNIEMLADALDEIVKAAKERHGDHEKDATEAATSTC